MSVYGDLKENCFIFFFQIVVSLGTHKNNPVNDLKKCPL